MAANTVTDIEYICVKDIECQDIRLIQAYQCSQIERFYNIIFKPQDREGSYPTGRAKKALASKIAERIVIAPIIRP